MVGELTLERDVSSADWLAAGGRFEYDVTSLVPSSFEAYARLLHPALQFVASRAEAGRGARKVQTAEGERWETNVRWAEVAAARGRAAHPAMDWRSIAGDLAGEADLWMEAPDEGSLPAEQASRLAKILDRYTTTPSRCWFAVWDGFGYLTFDNRDLPKVRMPHRPMVLFSGPLSAADTSFAEPPWHQSASLWWPEDRSWCVATDVDLKSTYIGATRACIGAITVDDQLEAYPVSATDPLVD